MNPTANAIGTPKRIRPPHIVPTRSRYSIPAGMISAVDVSEVLHGDLAGGEHVVRPRV